MRSIAAAACVVVALAAPARAGEDRLDSTATPSTAPADAPTPAPVEQPFSYMVDTHGPAPKQVLAGYALAFSSTAGAIRPIPGNFDSEGVVHALSLEVGVLDRLRVFADTMIAESIGTTSEVNAVAVQVGARLLLTPPSWQRFRLMIAGAFLREFGADLGAFGELTASYDLGRVRLAASLHGERVFATGRDPIDLYAVAGVSVRVARPVRLGVEYVAQDLEEATGEDAAEGGTRQYVGPDIALSLHKDRVLLTAGGAVQLAHSPGLLARAAVTYVY